MSFLYSWIECHHLEKIDSGRVSALLGVHMCAFIYVYDLIPATKEVEADEFRITLAI